MKYRWAHYIFTVAYMANFFITRMTRTYSMVEIWYYYQKYTASNFGYFRPLTYNWCMLRMFTTAVIFGILINDWFYYIQLTMTTTMTATWSPKQVLTVGSVDNELPVSAYHPVNARQTQPAVERRRPAHRSSTTDRQTASVTTALLVTTLSPALSSSQTRGTPEDKLWCSECDALWTGQHGSARERWRETHGDRKRLYNYLALHLQCNITIDCLFHGDFSASSSEVMHITGE